MARFFHKFGLSNNTNSQRQILDAVQNVCFDRVVVRYYTVEVVPQPKQHL